MDLLEYLEAYGSGSAQIDAVITNITSTFSEWTADEQDRLIQSVKNPQVVRAFTPQQLTTITKIIEGAIFQKSRTSTSSSSRSASFPIGEETSAPASLLPEPGSVLKSRFVLEELLGGGGMGVVYKALDLRKQEADDRNPHIAIKFINETFRENNDALIVLQREARKAQSLAHPNIITVYDFDRDGDHVFMTMELLIGSSLDKIIKENIFRDMAITEVIRIINEVGKALSYAHENYIVHCDLKPGNIMITKTGRVKVFDFGIARAIRNVDDPGLEVTRFDPGVLGALTPAYASPEMIFGQEPDPRDDIYALACISYELLSGKHPFNRMPSLQAMGRDLHPARIEGLSRRQWQALQHALAFERDARTTTVAEFLDGFNAKPENSRPHIARAAIIIACVVAGGMLYEISPRVSARYDAVMEWAAQRGAEEAAQAEAKRKAEEAAQAEAKRKAEEAAQAEAKRKAEEAAQAEAKRKAEEAAQAEAKRKAEEAAQAEAKRKAEEAAQAEAKRKAEEAAQAEAKRKAEEAAQAEAKRKAEEAAQAETKRKAEEAAQAETKRKAEEAAQAEAKRKAEEAAQAEAQRTAEKPTAGVVDEANWSIDETRELQRALKVLGRYRGPIDGEFGPGTRDAVRDFRRSESSLEGGELSRPERDTILSMARELSTPGVLIITTEPATALITVDGVRQSQPGSAQVEVPPGDHIIITAGERLVQRETKVHVQPGAHVQLLLQLTRAPQIAPRNSRRSAAVSREAPYSPPMPQTAPTIRPAAPPRIADPVPASPSASHPTISLPPP